MQLKKLEVECILWGDLEGQYKGIIAFDSSLGEIKCTLSPEQITGIFAICADGLIGAAKEAAATMTCSIIEQQKQIGEAL